MKINYVNAKELVTKPEYTGLKLATPSNFAIATFSGGKGDESDPYLINNVEQFKSIYLYKGKSFKLISDLDFTNLPLTSGGIDFEGNLNGNGFKLRNINITSNGSTIGLFRYVLNSRLENIIIENISIDSPKQINAGTLAGYIENTQVINCSVIGDSKIILDKYAGGLIGSSNNSNIENSFTTVSIIAKENIGGLVGYFSSESGDNYIKNSFSLSQITHTGTEDFNGLIVSSLNSGKVENTFFDGFLLSEKEAKLIGTLISGEISNSFYNKDYLLFYNEGDISAKKTDELILLSTFSEWNFKDVWKIENSVKHPTLINNKSEITYPIGTNKNPIQITTKEDLINIKNNIYGSYKLLNDIDLENMEWEPIQQFSGILDGSGYSIKNLNINKPTISFVGLFRKILNGKIENLKIDSANITGYSAVSAIGGSIDKSIIKNISVYGTGKIVGTTSGAIGGSVTKSNIEFCFSNIEMAGNSNNGGLVGMFEGKPENYIKNSYSISKIKGNDATYFYNGGLVGEFRSGILENSFYAGNFQILTNVSGVVGNYLGGEIINTYFDREKLPVEAKTGIGLSSGEMLKESSYPDFDFENIWEFKPGDFFPTLKLFLQNNESNKLEKHQIAYRYDKIGRVTQIDYGAGKSIKYIYDKAGNILSIKITKTKGA